MNSVGTGRAGGKVILLGEHAVVYGHPALAAGLSKGAVVEARTAKQTSLRLAPFDVEVTLEEDQDLARALRAVLESYPKPLPPLRLEARLEVPAGAGLGSSAALGVATIRAIDDLIGNPPDNARVTHQSLVWERIFHGNPSGVDNAMAARGGIGVFRKGEDVMPIDVPQPLCLVIGNSGEPASTKLTVAEVARQVKRDPKRLQKTFDGIEAIVQNGQRAIKDGDMPAFGQLMTLNQMLLSALMVSTIKLEEMCDLAKQHGAHGAKLTGGGGGGCMIALVPDEKTGENVVAALNTLGCEAFYTEAG